MDAPLIFDAHLDLSMNAMEWNRDLRLSVEEIRERESGMSDKPDRAQGTVSLPALREGNVGICVATQIARYVKKGSTLPGWYSPEQAWAQTQAQFEWYRTMEQCGEMVQITNLKQLQAHLANWDKDPGLTPIGYILSLEGADSIINMDYLEKAYQNGLRAIGPAHYGPGTYAFGTDSDGPLGSKGRELLKKISELGLILDVTHLSDTCFWEAMDLYSGPLWASHNNCRVLVNHNRQFSDEQIKEIINRKGVIGVAMDAWMLTPNWQRGVSTPQSMNVGLQNVVDHIDHICQLAGNANHVGIGTDLDGAFGKEQSPKDLDSIADLQKLPELLGARGYSTLEIQQILNGNFLSFLEQTWV
ncbi:dipeptidase [Croceivirga thetidis]|uniref:Peptidase M19 n=1 Tax=Croceivirga thetidis TaxID=2721623 RepID=A0ABX1GRW8_9FLAO|nr:membrane dipeptidase [Croceivirga thetidis]NKI32671.1 peptidase M19 [Croceivirga thetidis]